MHLILLDFLLALVQLTTLIVAFGATVPSDLEASTSSAAAGGGEAAREYGGLLGEEEELEDFDEESEEGDEAGEGEGEERRSGRERRRGGYVGLEDLDNGEEEYDDGVLSPSLAAYGAAKPSFSSPATTFPSHMILPPVADIRLPVLWREVRQSAATSARVREDRRTEEAEEGRGGGGEG
ncbi:hypothetical protein JCM11251_006779 [Rhodosporidiobolus azoricus]